MAQTQTPTILRAGSYETIDYTPAAGAQVYGGDVVVINNDRVCIAVKDIPDPAGVMALDGSHVGALASQHGRWVSPKVTGVAFAIGDNVYWNAAGNPVVGTAGSGAMTNAHASGLLAGVCIKAAAAGDATVEYSLNMPGGNQAA